MHSEPFFAIELGTSSVKAFLGQVAGASSQVLGSSVQPLAEELRESGGVEKERFRGAAEAIERALGPLRRGKYRKLRQTIFASAGGFIRGYTMRGVFPRERPNEALELAELKNILQKLAWASFERIRKRVKEELGRAHPALKVVHAAIEEMKVDGYAVEELLGRTGSELALSVYHTYLLEEDFAFLKELAREFNLEILGTVDSTYALARALGKPDGILIDIGGSSTQVSVVRHHIFEGSRVFQLGGDTLSRHIARELGLGIWEGEYIKRRFVEGTLSERVGKQIGKVLERDLALWQSGVGVAVKEFSGLEMLPEEIILTGGGALFGGFQASAKKLGKTVRVLDPEELGRGLSAMAQEFLRPRTTVEEMLERMIRIVQT
ncbi:hypothetical protein HYW30_02175 [Candidatus Azambacteria bacterium]|nr:hypothetical protein [Candidatus Azambacteria bacterium]